MKQEICGFNNCIPDRTIKYRFDSIFDIGRNILPEPIKDFARKRLNGVDPKYPLDNPQRISVGGYEANYWIKSSSDWYRLVDQKSEVEYASEMMRTLGKINKAVFFDIGAAQGKYSLAAVSAGAGEVVAFDPDPLSYTMFDANLSLNPEMSKKVRLLPIGLGDQENTFSLFTDKRGINAPSMKYTNKGFLDVVQIKVYKLDDLIDSGLIPLPDVVKIDVEGAEMMVLRGMHMLLSSSNKPPHIFIEIHSKYLKQFGSNVFELVRLLNNFGYRDMVTWQQGVNFLSHFVINE